MTRIAAQFAAEGCTTLELRRELAGAAFARTAAYDTAIAATSPGLAADDPGETADGNSHGFPQRVVLPLERHAELRYGENPHQSAAALRRRRCGSQQPRPCRAAQRQGALLQQSARPRCGPGDCPFAAATGRGRPETQQPLRRGDGGTLGDAVAKAWDGDPVSAFGSVLGVNVPVDAAMAEYLAEPGRFVEAIVAPDFTPEALEILTTKPKWKANVRLLRVGRVRSRARARAQFRQIDGGMLCQATDDLADDDSAMAGRHRDATLGRAPRRPGICLGRLPSRQIQRDRARQRSACWSASAPGR